MLRSIGRSDLPEREGIGRRSEHGVLKEAFLDRFFCVHLFGHAGERSGAGGVRNSELGRKAHGETGPS